MKTAFILATLLSLTALAHAQTPASAPAGAAAAEWKYKTQRLKAAEVDALLAQPDKLLVLDLRRPDELIKYGSFPVFLNIQNRDLEKHLAYLPKDRAIPKIDPQITFRHDERLIGIFVVVPNKVTLQLHDLELVVVHFGDDLWLPSVVEQPELLAEVDRFVAHVTPPSFDRETRALATVSCVK